MIITSKTDLKNFNIIISFIYISIIQPFSFKTQRFINTSIKMYQVSTKSEVSLFFLYKKIILITLIMCICTL